tara:strand:- start:401 stop:688 length:288 start_codon:yes stop_codon:yes gene_type:complete
MDKKKSIEDYLGPDSEAMLMDGYDDCIAGVLERFGMDQIIVYDKEKIIKRHMDDGMTHEEAIEYFEFNQLGAWVGDRTPAFITTTDSMQQYAAQY